MTTATTGATARTARFHSLDEVQRLNDATGHHWFSPDTRRFFGTRVHATLYGGRYFVTSEFRGFGREASGRAFTVREALADGSIGTVGEFLGYASRSGAHAAARSLAGER